MEYQNDNLTENNLQQDMQEQDELQANINSNEMTENFTPPKLNDCQVKKQNPDYRRALIYSALGIVLAPFVIIGLIFAFFGIANARNELAYTNQSNEKPSQTLIWAYWLGIAGIVVNFGVLLTYILFAVL